MSPYGQKANGMRGSALERGETPACAEVPSAHADLAPTARRLLEAARRLLERSGYEALSLEAIGREAGENKSLIWYHFGGKPGLLVALVDWILYDVLRDLQRRVEEMPAGEERQRTAADHSRQLIADTQAYRLFFALLPHLMESGEPRRRLAALYAQYRTMNATALSADEEDLSDARALASMIIALTDGLAMQLLMDPGSVEMDRVMRLWEVLVEAVLAAPAAAGVTSA